jgi:hypothetical protein
LSANWRASSKPIPLDAPVTTASGLVLVEVMPAGVPGTAAANARAVRARICPCPLSWRPDLGRRGQFQRRDSG